MRYYDRVILFSSLILLLTTSRYTHAYLDPGTGSAVTQAIIAGALGGIVLFRTFFGKLKHLLKNKAKGKEKASDAEGKREDQ